MANTPAPAPAPAPAAGGGHGEEKKKRTLYGWLIAITVVGLALFFFFVVNGITWPMAINAFTNWVRVVSSSLFGAGEALKDFGSRGYRNFMMGGTFVVVAILSSFLVLLISAFALSWLVGEFQDISEKQKKKKGGGGTPAPAPAPAPGPAPAAAH